MPYLAKINLVTAKSDFGWHEVVVGVPDEAMIKELYLERAVRTIVDRKIDRNKVVNYKIKGVKDVRKLNGL
jgi:hypothetical protein